MRTRWPRRILGVVLAVLTATVLLVAAALPATAMTVTFVRHAESQANFDGVIDTSVPGPGITPAGKAQALAVADKLAATGIDYDAIYTSTMQRTSETAEPFAKKTGLEPTPLAGVREISAGVFEGSSEDHGLGRIGYVLAPIGWLLGVRSIAAPGAEDGNYFDSRVDGALKEIEDSGAQNPVVFSHSATIMFWTMMNVKNPDLGVMLRHQLDNTDVVVVDGNAEDGWTLKSWAGRPVGPASLGTKLFVNTRDLVVAPQTAAYNVVRAFRSGDIRKIANAIRDGVGTVVKAPIRFAVSVARDIAQEVTKVLRPGHSSTATATASSTATATATTTSTAASATAAAPTPKKTATTTEKPAAPVSKKRNGATDLTKGNKVEPGQADTVSSKPGKDEPETVPTSSADEPKPAEGAEPAQPQSEGSEKAAA